MHGVAPPAVKAAESAGEGCTQAKGGREGGRAGGVQGIRGGLKWRGETGHAMVSPPTQGAQQRAAHGQGESGMACKTFSAFGRSEGAVVVMRIHKRALRMCTASPVVKSQLGSLSKCSATKCDSRLDAHLAVPRPPWPSMTPARCATTVAPSAAPPPAMRDTRTRDATALAPLRGTWT